jgi:hypothetical protein
MASGESGKPDLVWWSERMTRARHSRVQSRSRARVVALLSQQLYTGRRRRTGRSWCKLGSSE